MYLWPVVWCMDRVVNKGVSGVCICSVEAFWHSGNMTTRIISGEKVGTGCFLRPGGVFKMESQLPVGCSDALTSWFRWRGWLSLHLWWKEKEKKNNLATRQHVLLPVFVSTYCVLPASRVGGWVGGGTFKKALGAPREELAKNINKTNSVFFFCEKKITWAPQTRATESCFMNNNSPLWPIIMILIQQPLRRLNSKLHVLWKMSAQRRPVVPVTQIQAGFTGKSQLTLDSLCFLSQVSQ